MNFFQPIEQRTASNTIRFKPGETTRLPMADLNAAQLRVGPLSFKSLNLIPGTPILGGEKVLACCLAINPSQYDVCFTLYLVACDLHGGVLASFSLSPRLHFLETASAELLACYGMVQPDFQTSIDHLLVKAVIHQLDAETVQPDPR